MSYCLNWETERSEEWRKTVWTQQGVDRENEWKPEGKERRRISVMKFRVSQSTDRAQRFGEFVLRVSIFYREQRIELLRKWRFHQKFIKFFFYETCHFHFRIMQSLIIYELWHPLLLIFELHCAQLDEDKVIVHLFLTELRNFILKIWRQMGYFKRSFHPVFFMIHP
jgi:hypothetical protein